jgi:hypothetical protein
VVGFAMLNCKSNAGRKKTGIIRNQKSASHGSGRRWGVPFTIHEGTKGRALPSWWRRGGALAGDEHRERWMVTAAAVGAAAARARGLGLWARGAAGDGWRFLYRVGSEWTRGSIWAVRSWPAFCRAWDVLGCFSWPSVYAFCFFLCVNIL